MRQNGQGFRDLEVKAGAFDGLTIMRYAHIYRHRVSGGVEQYLRLLNRGLLERHRLTVLQTYLTTNDAAGLIEADDCGVGRILWVPVPVREMAPKLPYLPRRIAYVYGRTLQMSRTNGTDGRHEALSSMKTVFRHKGGHLRHNAIVLSDHLPGLLESNQVSLLALHWTSYESDALISRACERGMPFTLTNHFDNARLQLPGVREWLPRAAAIGGVSNLSIPAEVADRYVNLSDAIDTEFFSPGKARSRSQSRSVVLLPARIQTGKGHLDLLMAARILSAKGVDFDVCFAGGVDSETLHQQLRRSVEETGLKGRVYFAGEQSAEELREWYACSSVVVLPSHSEGLGRVLLEAQAMMKPVVAYNCGGMSEAVIPGETGYLVEKANVEALVEKIGLLLKTEAERLRMGERGREFVVKRFGLSEFIRRHELFLLNALSTVRNGCAATAGVQ
jgi:glycosyltransferase involved in cell wall biosynthesis